MFHSLKNGCKYSRLKVFSISFIPKVCICIPDSYSELRRAFSRFCVCQQTLWSGFTWTFSLTTSSLTVTHLDYLSQTSLLGVVIWLSSSK